jgi:MFS family permease
MWAASSARSEGRCSSHSSPNVAAGLDASFAQVAAAITAYMVPFALLQLVSGTLAERLGPRRVVRGGYVAFGLAALGCAFAPDIWAFLAARAAMGASNAFLSPILLAALSEVVAPDVLGRTVGTLAAAQTAGLMLAPILGGLLGEVSWRLAFVLVAVRPSVSCSSSSAPRSSTSARAPGAY